MTDLPSPQDLEIINRISALRHTEPDYPAELLERRRATFRKAALGLGGIGLIGFIVKKLMHIFPQATQAAVQSGLEIVLVSALVVEASVVGYTFRGEIKELLGFGGGNGTPLVTQTSGTFQTLQPGQETASAAAKLTGTPTLTLTATGTPTPTPTITGTLIFPTDTPVPHPYNPTHINPTPTDGNPGHHFGQTKTPVPQTKDDDHHHDDHHDDGH